MAGESLGPSEGHRRPSVRLSSRQLVSMRSSLSARHLAILESIAMLHYITTRQVERLQFHSTKAPPGPSTRRRAQAALAKLHDLGLIHRLDRQIGGARAGSAAYIWKLAPAGARLVHTPYPDSREPGLAHLDHVLEVAELVVRLHEHVRPWPVRQWPALNVEAEPACWRPLRAAHRRHGGWLKPDLRVTISAAEHELHWFVEVDRGTEHHQTLTRKVETYLAAWREGGEQSQVGVFPGVLWVVPDRKRVRSIEQVLASIPDVPDGMFVIATRHEAIEALADEAAGAR